MGYYYKKFMSVNMDGALKRVWAVVPHMRESGGSIVNQSSTAAWVVLHLLRSGEGRDQRPHPAARVRTRLVEHPDQRDRPGPIDTEATRTVTPGNIVADMVKRIPLQRMGTPEDLVGMCLFLLSNEASWITGQIFNVDGGQVIRS